MEFLNGILSVCFFLCPCPFGDRWIVQVFMKFFVMVTSECTARNECLACGVPFNVMNGVGVSFFFLCISNL